MHFSALFSIIPLLALLSRPVSTSPLRARQEVIDLATSATVEASTGATTSEAASASTSVAESSAAAVGVESGVPGQSSIAAESTAAEATASASASASDGGSAVAAAADTSNDLTVVKFAALAELLEKTFYEQALAKFDAQAFTDASFVDGQVISDQLQFIPKDESTHLSVLQSVAQSLGSSTADIDTCTFNFDPVLGDVKRLLATARLLEYVGIDAYIGGTTLIEDKGLLVSAAESTTVEARHNTVLNTFNSGSAVPNAFDMVLTPPQVLSVAAPFVSGGCDPVAALGLTSTPALTITNAEPATPGTTLTFGGAGLEGVDQAGLFCNMIIGGAAEAISLPIAECVVPANLDEAVHLFLVNSSTPLSANIVTQDGSTIVAGLLLVTGTNAAASIGAKKKIVITQTIVEETIA